MKSKSSAATSASPAAKAGTALPLGFPVTDAEWEAHMAAAGGASGGASAGSADTGVFFPAGTTMDERRAVFADRANQRAPRSRERGPQKAPTKQLVSLRIAAATLDRWRATGPGWQGRMDEWLAKGPA